VTSGTVGQTRSIIFSTPFMLSSHSNRRRIWLWIWKLCFPFKLAIGCLNILLVPLDSNVAFVQSKVSHSLSFRIFLSGYALTKLSQCFNTIVASKQSDLKI